MTGTIATTMFTVCPKCTLTLAVTAADLRAGQGYVRCGRCLNVFNALLALSEEPVAGGATTHAYSPADRASTSQITAAMASAPQEPAHIEALSAAPAGAAHDAPPRSPLPTERSSDGAIETESSLADGTGTFETIVLEGDAITQTEEFVPEETVDSEIAALAQRLNVAPHQLQVAEADSEAGATAAGVGEAGAVPDIDEVPVDAAEILPQMRRSHPGRWAAGCALLALLLALQAINHWRDALAAAPALSAPMTRLYTQLGVPLDPHWNLAAYDVRQQGAASDPADSHIVRVRLSLANHAPRPQPVPLLRLTLLDRYGKSIAMRDLTPQEYWPAGHAPRAFLAPDERIDSEVAVRDPNADSTSFELDVCLRSGAAVRCAGDTVLAPAPVPLP